MEELGFRLRTEANLEALTEEVTKSSEIEGEVLSRDQVRSSLARRLGVDIGAFTLVERNVEGIVEMMLDATGRYEAPLTSDRLFGWHGAIGRIKAEGVEIAWRTHERSDPEVLKEHLQRLNGIRGADPGAHHHPYRW